MKLLETTLKWMGITIGLAILTLVGFVAAVWLSPGNPDRSYLIAALAAATVALVWRLVMSREPTQPGFSDRVRIKVREETERHGLAGREGQVYGWTTPSMTGVPVIGSPHGDHAVNVHFDDSDEDHWFSADLLELLDRGAGTVARLDGSDVEWVRLPNGEWQGRPRSE
jgi:hypothetical protein